MVGCPTCGAELHFNIDLQKMVCDYCGNAFDINQISDNSIRDDAKTSCFDSYVYICPSCGAEILTTDKNDAVGFCQYCGNQSLVFDKVRKEWPPDGIIPFRVTSDECKQLYVKEAKKYFFVSRKYKNPDRLGAFRGIYMPFWDYNISVNSGILFKAVTDRKYLSDSRYKISTYNIVGKLNYKSSGYSHDASANFDDTISEGVVPFNNDGIVDFAPGFLSGFYAEVGNVDPNEYKYMIKDQAIEVEKEKIFNDSKMQSVLAIKHIDIIENEDKRIPIRISSAKKILKPVWFLSYKNKNKITYSAVNGQTGRVSADLPLSPIRILLTSLVASFFFFLVFLLTASILPAMKPNSVLAICSELLLFGDFLLYGAFVETIRKNQIKNKIKIKIKKETRRRLDPKSLFFGISFYLLVTFPAFFSSFLTSQFFNIAIVPAVLIVLFFILKRRQYARFKEIDSEEFRGVNNFRKRILTEAQKTNRIFIISQIFIYITVLCSVVVAFLGFANNSIVYSLCVFQAVELFVLALIHIFFQSNIAKRPLPQFKKHGLSSQEKDPND